MPQIQALQVMAAAPKIHHTSQKERMGTMGTAFVKVKLVRTKRPAITFQDNLSVRICKPSYLLVETTSAKIRKHLWVQ